MKTTNTSFSKYLTRKMGHLNQHHAVVFFFLLSLLLHFQVIIISSQSFSPSSAHNKCNKEESFALLQFKNYFFTEESISTNRDILHFKVDSWRNGTDCCSSWEGVTCDKVTGHVIGLDLSSSYLEKGPIYSNSTLFLLTHLQSLNLANNQLYNSTIPSQIGQLMNLTHLNLSSSIFSGHVPKEISHLSQLVSLDLSHNFLLSLEKSTWQRLVQNLTNLEELHLDDIKMLSIEVSSLFDLPSSLISLSLRSSGLNGKLSDDSLRESHLKSLRFLDLSGNVGISGELPDSIDNLRSLETLYLGSCSVSGSLPMTFGNLTRLTKLDLNQNNFTGVLPSTLSNLKELSYLDLSFNKFSSNLPSSLSNLKKLSFVDLHSNNFSGELPSLVSMKNNLTYVDFRANNFTGRIPTHMFTNFTQLSVVRFSQNSLIGPIPNHASELSNLEELDLSDNKLTGMIPPWLYSLPSLKILVLSSNLFSGHIYDFQVKSLEILRLNDNNLDGPIPRSIYELSYLQVLELQSNKLSGYLDVNLLPNLRFLDTLDLSSNSISPSTYNSVNHTNMPAITFLSLSSCNITKFPKFLRNLRDLQFLDLSNNGIHDQFPEWLPEVGILSLSYLNLANNFLSGKIVLHLTAYLDHVDLHNNTLDGPLPHDLPSTIQVFLLSNNNLSGEIPSSICNMDELTVLDLSFNNFSGMVPQCFENLKKLFVLDLQMNKFHGAFFPHFKEGKCNLRSLHLTNNELNGSIPHSLVECEKLEVLALGNNKINDTFPYWLEKLPNLQILVLRSNRFHGPIGNPMSEFSFMKLRVIDLSHNEFSGQLPANYIDKFKAMINVVDDPPNSVTYMGNTYYRDSVMLTSKGQFVRLVRILTIFTTIDFSSNNFVGEIPVSVGKLKSLKGLNFSHNHINGSIPPSLSNLSNLEWLDLSSNMLNEEIPKELADLTSLSFLNLSENSLVGPIPLGKQFNTFANDSYLGNSGLCGFPLSHKCNSNEGELPPSSGTLQQDHNSEGFIDGFHWKSVVLGYGCGTVIGILFGYYILFVRKPQWLRRI